MSFGRRRRQLTNLVLVLLVLVLARLAEVLVGDRAASAALIIVVLMGLQTLVFAELAQNSSAGFAARLRRVVGIRIFGFAAVSLLVVGSYVFQRIFVLGDWSLHGNLLWLLLPLCFSALIDAICSRPYVDEYWTVGKALRTARVLPTKTCKRDFGSAFIKVFFYPLMFVYIERYLGEFREAWRPETWSNVGIYDSLVVYYILVDLIFGASGYALSLRVLDNRVRSINPYPIGWFVTLICYSPFWDLMGIALVFHWHADWIRWTKEWPIVQSIWLVMIAGCLVVYAWATVELGIRFSNLTYRGTVSSGPYRWMKHPAYVAKISSYWLIAVPFIPMHGWSFALQQCLVLLVYCAIYYLRARFEEKHLLQYEDYKAYAAGFAGRTVPATNAA